MESDVAAQTHLTTPEKIRQNLLDRFALQQMPEITPEDITVTQFRDKVTVRITHRYKERLYRDRYLRWTSIKRQKYRLSLRIKISGDTGKASPPYHLTRNDLHLQDVFA